MAPSPTADRAAGGSIRLRASILTSALIALALVAVISYTFLAVRTALLRAGEARANAAAEQLAGIIGAPLPGRVAEVQRLVDHDSVRQALTNPSADAQAEAIARLKPITINAQQHQTLELWSASGTRAFGIQIPPSGGSVPLAAALPQGVGVLPYVLVNGEVVSELVVPVRADGTESPIGYLLSRRLATGVSTPDALNRLIGGGGRVMVGNQSGTVWTDIAKRVDGPPIDVATPGSHRYRTADGARIAGVAHVAATPLAIVIDFPQAAIIAPAWSLLRQLVIVGFVFTAIAVLVVWRLSARVTQPLNRLIDALGAAREGDFSRRVEIDRDTEVGRLAQAFNSMAEKIQAGLLELDARARELKAKDNLEEENRRVVEASRLKSEFLANMSHELRTPLNAIIGFAELIYDGHVTPDMPQFKEFMHDILTSGQHLLQLINDVLDLSKVEAGRLEFHPEETHLEKAVAESIGILRTMAAQKQITIAHEVDQSLGTVFVDRARLKQVLYNYLSNAIKFTPEEGRIAVTVSAVGGADFRIAVRDTGVGIAPADLPRLFIEFNQLEAGAAKKHQGTGLGLALTKRLIEAQGGTVGVHSTPGEGSTFFAVLPRRATKGKPVAGPRSIASSRLDAETVLVIEDDAADQEAIAAALLAAGFNVEIATTRAQALVKLGAQTFGAITLDLILPDASGADVLRDLRASERNRGVPVIVLTLVGADGVVAGFSVRNILTKPVNGAALLAALGAAGLSPRAAAVPVAQQITR
jgi:signal transduction histidine kinase/CheY-like chemotaxis protein